jgi:CHAT domain-containing protein
MKVFRKSRLFLFALGAIAAAILVSVAVHVLSHPAFGTPEFYLAEADEMAFNNNWMGAAPLYKTAQTGFLRRGDTDHALYAEVSQIPATMESRPLGALIGQTNAMLHRPGANDPRVHLRILTVKGILELEYDAALAKATWSEVEREAKALGEYRLASRANGEQGILAFLLGNVGEASSRVKSAYLKAKILLDQPAQVRYASLIGRGILELGRYKESLSYLDKAISLADAHPEIARPMIAYAAKVDALVGLKRYDEALRLADHIVYLSRTRKIREHLAQALAAKASVLQAKGDWSGAIESYTDAITAVQSLDSWRSLNGIEAALAKAYEHQSQFDAALKAIDAAIAANRRTPDEIYFVPRNLAIKAEILAKSGRRKQAESVYQNGSEMLEVLLRHVPTPLMERSVLSEVSELYSGYFTLLADENRLPEAFATIERAHGRLEAQSLWYDKLRPPEAQTPAERDVNALELRLLDTTDGNQRAVLLNKIYDVEQSLPSYSPGPFREPVSLAALQQQLSPDEALLEYVLSEPTSSVLTVTTTAVHRYTLPSRSRVEDDCRRYFHEISKKQTDTQLARRLYTELLPAVSDIHAARILIIVPDGALNVLPFSALVNPQDNYLVTTKTIINAPSATVLNLLRTRGRNRLGIPYLGVAAWTETKDTRPWVVRAITGPERSQLVPLPESEHEIEAAASLLPHPDKLLVGANATRTNFLRLPLAKYDVLHLALHGYADMEFPDRSALVFAPAPQLNDSGFLQAREIRQLHLNARLVTLSACKTAVGPIDETGANTIVNAFIEAGAQSVVSTLWDVDDRPGSKLMESFYQRLANGEGRAEALREAKLEFVKSGLAPYYWANFQMVGDAVEPLYPDRKLAGIGNSNESHRSKAQ